MNRLPIRRYLQLQSQPQNHLQYLQSLSRRQYLKHLIPYLLIPLAFLLLSQNSPLCRLP